MKTHKAYSKYKTSGVDWLGYLPEHWDVRRLGSSFIERREKVSDKDFPPLSVTKNGVVPQLETAAKTDDGDNRKKVCFGDFVINSRSDRKGSSGLSKHTGSVSLINTVIKPLKINADFANYLLKSYPFQEEYYRYGKGIVADLWSTNYSEMKNIIIPLPELHEQKSIANFLDKNTVEIDTLIEKQTKLIVLLKEKRQAVISHAVTKGLNPNVPMKNSGVEWLGEVPEHWEVKPGKYIGKIQSTPSMSDDNLNEIGDIFYIKVDDLNYVEGNTLTEAKHKVSNSCKDKRPISGFICFPKRGAAIFTNKACLVEVKAMIDPNLMAWKIFKPYSKEYILQLLIVRGLTEIADISTVPQINNKHLDPLMFPIPPKTEQLEIIKFLCMKIVKIDNLISKTQKSIELLKEKRTALISAAVTGKIDVREAT